MKASSESLERRSQIFRTSTSASSVWRGTVLRRLGSARLYEAGSDFHWVSAVRDARVLSPLTLLFCGRLHRREVIAAL